MIELNIKSIPNQSVDFVYNDSDFYKLHLYTWNGLTFCDVNLNGSPVICGVLCFPEVNIIPLPYLTNGGNFRFKCINKDNPYYTNFGISQNLLFYTDEELKELT